MSGNLNPREKIERALPELLISGVKVGQAGEPYSKECGTAAWGRTLEVAACCGREDLHGESNEESSSRS